MKARAFDFPLLVLSLAFPSSAATQFHSVDLHILPPQSVRAITIRGGEATRAVEVRNGKALVPADLPLPWSLGLVRFEADVYTREHLSGRRPWVIRELGVVRGRLQRRPLAGERFTWLLARGGSHDVEELDLAADERGAFEVRLAAGTYDGVLLGPSYATRIRSGIVVKPGQATDLGVVVPEPAVPVELRVVDSGGRAGVAGARVIWDPPPTMLNAALSRRLYARRWSGVTDRRGVVQLRAIGPVPHSVRWRIEAEGFATASSAAAVLKEPVRFTVPDVHLQPRPSVVVRVHFPREGREELEGAALVVGENRDPGSHDFVPVSRVKLRPGETRVSFTSYGPKRVWVEHESGRKLVFEDFEVTAPASVVDFVLRQAEIRGRVVQRDRPVAGALVSLADPRNGNQFLAQVPSADDGRFRFTTWATGKMTLYTIGPGGGRGKRVGNAHATLELSGKSEADVELEVPGSGFSLSVVDAETGEAVEARLDIRSRFPDGSGRMGGSETDTRGRFELSGFPDGTASVIVTAKGYRAATVDVPIRADAPEQTIRLERAGRVSGRVVDVHGLPVRASVIGGFVDEHDPQPRYMTSTDAEGRFAFDAAPPAGTILYVIASGHALGRTLLAEREVVVTLHPPSASIVTLRQHNAPPEKVFLVLAAPAGQERIPITVMEELARANGMSLYQLCGSSVTGEVILPEFLGPGTYDLFLARRGGKPFLYEKVGTIRAPLVRHTVLAIGSS